MTFRIKQFGELSGWRPIEMAGLDVRLITKCPCCTKRGNVICSLIDHENGWSLSSCECCGHVWYSMPPTPEWFDSFYADTWDTGKGHSVADMIAYLKNHDDDRDLNSVSQNVRHAQLPPDAKILDVGCGYGRMLNRLKGDGYQNLYGVDTSKHRVEVVRGAYGFPVHCGPFDSVPDDKFDLIYSFHCLEHCYDPAAFMRKCASLQDDGGLVMIAVPNFFGEPTMGVCLFLPHLHSFNVRSLAYLMMRHGYSPIAKNGEDSHGLVLLGRKTKMKLEDRGNGDMFSAAKAKFRKGLCDGLPVRKYLLWERDKDNATFYDELPDLSALKYPRWLEVEPCEPVTDAPFEIQFDGPVRLCVK